MGVGRSPTRSRGENLGIKGGRKMRMGRNKKSGER